jgi:undecaprenyl pyrophosphate synthase
MATIEINHGKRHEIIDEVKKLTETIRQSRRKQQLLEEGITELKKARMRKMAK